MDQNFIVFLICMGAGLVLVLGGMYLLYAQRFVRSLDGTIEMELPFIGRVKTNYPSLAAIFLGALLLLYPLNKWQPQTPTVAVTGRITLPASDAQRNVLVFVVPNENKTFTNDDGTYTVQVRAGEPSYTGIAYLPPVTKVETVQGDPKNGLKFDVDLTSP